VSDKRIAAQLGTYGGKVAVSQLNDLPQRSPSDAKVYEFEAVYAEYLSFVWRCLRNLGVPDRGLDDAAQEVFIVVHRGLSGFRGDSQLRTWLYGIVRNVAYKQARRVQRKDRAEPIDEQISSRDPTPSERAEEAQAADFVQRFALGLPEKKREVFMLALVEQFTIPEVAEMTGIPLNTAYTRLRAVRTEFREALLRHRGANDSAG
jgi:RNA polymerase sigma-70 factor, ECF subfamily